MKTSFSLKSLIISNWEIWMLLISKEKQIILEAFGMQSSDQYLMIAVEQLFL